MAPKSLSIGEVLTQLQPDFPDVTISKIRFLESQGLVSPERTPSGYRKFGVEDLDTLVWVLQQQRDHFLPLRVIREKLVQGDHLRTGEELTEPGPGAEAGTPAPDDDAVAAPFVNDMGSVSLSLEKLSKASGLSVEEIAKLEAFQMIESSTEAGEAAYGSDALLVAQLAKGLGDFGLEPRHLRLLRTAAEREASVYEEAAMASIQRQSPVGRSETREALRTMSALGNQLRSVMMRSASREHFD